MSSQPLQSNPPLQGRAVGRRRWKEEKNLGFILMTGQDVVSPYLCVLMKIAVENWLSHYKQKLGLWNGRNKCFKTSFAKWESEWLNGLVILDILKCHPHGNVTTPTECPFMRVQMPGFAICKRNVTKPTAQLIHLFICEQMPGFAICERNINLNKNELNVTKSTECPFNIKMNWIIYVTKSTECPFNSYICV